MVYKARHLSHLGIRGFGGVVVRSSPFTSEVAGSILSENVLNVTRTQCSTHVKRVESRGFSPGTPVSSYREVDRVGWDKNR